MTRCPAPPFIAARLASTLTSPTPGKKHNAKSPTGKKQSTLASTPAPQVLHRSDSDVRLETALAGTKVFAKKTRRKMPSPIDTLPRVSQASTKDHWDLPSYLRHAKMHNLDLDSNVNKGTLFEYQVKDTLKSMGFQLTRTGRTGDNGIDLFGIWLLQGQAGLPIKVFLQCKYAKPSPSMVRELAGSYPGAAAGWDSANTMAFLVSSKPKTTGIDTTLNRSAQPLGFMQIDPEGNLYQMVWNEAANVAALRALSVKQAYISPDSDSCTKAIKRSVKLYWDGKPLTKAV